MKSHTGSVIVKFDEPKANAKVVFRLDSYVGRGKDVSTGTGSRANSEIQENRRRAAVAAGKSRIVEKVERFLGEKTRVGWLFGPLFSVAGRPRYLNGHPRFV